MTKSIDIMTPVEIVTEISDLRGQLNASAMRVHELSRALYSHTRRSASTSTTAAYITYSNGWTRFSGALVQGLKRTEHIDRQLDRAQKAEVMRKAQEEADTKAAEAKKAQRAVKAEAHSSLGDLISLYGEDMVRDATAR